MALTLRVPNDVPLTNQQLDDNFLYLDGRINSLSTFSNGLENALITSTTNLEGLINTKQPLHPRLTSISNLTSNGFLVNDGTTMRIRSIVSSNANNIIVLNENGVFGNVALNIGQNVLTNTSTHTVSNKTFSGLENVFTNLSLTSSVIGILPIANGGTNASTIEAARSNLNVLIKPTSTGIVTKTDGDASTVRQIIVSGIGLSITNGTGVLGNPLISSNATPDNTENTIVSRDNNGDFSTRFINSDAIILNRSNSNEPELRFNGNGFAVSDNMFRLVFDGNNNGNGRFVIGKSFTNPSQYTENTVNEVFSINNNGGIEAKTTNYETLITANNIITNKKYVDDKHNSTVQAVNAVQATVTNFINNSVVPRAAIMFNGSGSIIRAINCTVSRFALGRYRITLDLSVRNGLNPIVVLGESSTEVGLALSGGRVITFNPTFFDVAIDSRWTRILADNDDNVQLTASQQAVDPSYVIGISVF